MRFESSESGLDYRDRIYAHYVNARQFALAPQSIAGLKPRLPMLNKIIRTHFPKNKDAAILDLGCGHGAFLYACRMQGYTNLMGVDRSPEQVSESRRLGIEGVVEGDLLETLGSLPDCSRDVVIAFDVIEHFTKSELLGFIDEVRRVLKVGGKWIVHIPNGEALFGMRSCANDFTHELVFSRTSISQVLKSSGFSEVLCIEDAPVVHGVKSFVRWLFWKLFRGVLRFYLAVETGSGEKENIFSQNFLVVARK